MKNRFPLVASVALASTLAATSFAQNVPPAPPTAPIGVTTPQQGEPMAAPQQQMPPQEQIAPPGPRVLVIPFATLNVPEGEEWIGRGVGEAIVADFGHARAFSPIAFKGQLLVEDNATAISLAHKANADYVIRGAAQRVDQTLRITAQFIDARNGDTLAAATVTGSAKDLLKLEDDLSSQLRTSAMPIVMAEQRGQMNYIPGNQLQPQTSDDGNGPYYPGYEGAPAYTPGYTSNQPTYTDPGYANSYSPYGYSDYGYGYGYPYGYPYYGFYPGVVFFSGGFVFHDHDHDHDHDHGHDDHHWSGGNWNHGNGNGNWNGHGSWNGSNSGTLTATRSPRPVTGPFGSPNVGFNRGFNPMSGGSNTGFHTMPSGFNSGHVVSGGMNNFGFPGGSRGFSGGGMPSGGFGGGGFPAGGFGGGGMHGGGFGGGGFGGGGMGGGGHR